MKSLIVLLKKLGLNRKEDSPVLEATVEVAPGIAIGFSRCCGDPKNCKCGIMCMCSCCGCDLN